VEEGGVGRNLVGLQILWKKELESLSRLSLSEFKLATNKTLGYDMPRVSLKVICTARLVVFELIPVGRIELE